MRRLLAITGGVGGAKLALGLSKVLSPEELLFVVNTGDDFEHFGLHISPDIDSLTYALAEQNNQQLGWGRTGETWQFIETMESLGGDSWFRLGDKDMALHVRRTQLLSTGENLTQATAKIAQAMGIQHSIAPMSNDSVRTIVHTDQGALAFQHYFVRDRCQPKVSRFEFQGLDQASLNPLIEAYLASCDGIIICPSNPYVSVDPILALPGMRNAMQQLPTIAVSPIVGGMAIKGPAAKMMTELQVPASAPAVAQHYGTLLNGYVLDNTDAHLAGQIDLPTLVTDTIMDSLEKRTKLATACIQFFDTL